MTRFNYSPTRFGGFIFHNREIKAKMFLTPEEIAELTGRKVKRLQVEQLRTMGIPFFVNAVGRPIVVRSVLEGKKEAPQRPKWQSNLLRPVTGPKPGE